MKSRTTYWKNSFPNHLELTLHLEELKLAGAFDLPDDDDPVVIEGKKAKGCFVGCEVETGQIRGSRPGQLESAEIQFRWIHLGNGKATARRIRRNGYPG